MITLTMISFSIVLWVPMFPEKPESNKESDGRKSFKSHERRERKNLLDRLKKTRIVLKDNSIIKNCSVMAMDYAKIAYEQGGKFYDQVIEMIERIDILDGTMHAIFFDEKNNPEIGSYVY